MSDLLFITSNSHKVERLRASLNVIGINIKAVDLELAEIQSNDIREIALTKARSAYDVVGAPLVVTDSGLCIEALNGFPGPYTKYAQDMLGCDRLLHLMEREHNRVCHYEAVLAYVDGAGTSHLFEDKVLGSLSRKIEAIENAQAWGDFWKIFIPFGCNKTLSQMTDYEYEEHKASRPNQSVWHQLTQYLKRTQHEIS